MAYECTRPTHTRHTRLDSTRLDWRVNVDVSCMFALIIIIIFAVGRAHSVMGSWENLIANKKNITTQMILFHSRLLCSCGGEPELCTRSTSNFRFNYGSANAVVAGHWQPFLFGQFELGTKWYFLAADADAEIDVATGQKWIPIENEWIRFYNF